MFKSKHSFYVLGSWFERQRLDKIGLRCKVSILVSPRPLPAILLRKKMQMMQSPIIIIIIITKKRNYYYTGFNYDHYYYYSDWNASKLQVCHLTMMTRVCGCDIQGRVSTLSQVTCDVSASMYSQQTVAL